MARLQSKRSDFNIRWWRFGTCASSSGVRSLEALAQTSADGKWPAPLAGRRGPGGCPCLQECAASSSQTEQYKLDSGACCESKIFHIGIGSFII